MNFLEQLRKLSEEQKKIIIWIIIIILAVGLFYWSYQSFKSGFARIEQGDIKEQFNIEGIQEHLPET